MLKFSLRLGAAAALVAGLALVPTAASRDDTDNAAVSRHDAVHQWREDGHSDPASDRDLPGERLLRSLLRHVSGRAQPGRRAFVPRAPEHTGPEQLPLEPVAADQQSRTRTRTGSRSTHSGSAATTRSPATRTTTTTTSRRCSMATPTARRPPWTSSSSTGARSRPAPASDCRRPPRPIRHLAETMGYFDGNTVTGTLEPREPLRAERQLVRDDVRSVDARRGQPRRRNDVERRDGFHQQRCRQQRKRRHVLDLHVEQHGLQPDRQLLADEQPDRRGPGSVRR